MREIAENTDYCILNGRGAQGERGKEFAETVHQYECSKYRSASEYTEQADVDERVQKGANCRAEGLLLYVKVLLIHTLRRIWPCVGPPAKPQSKTCQKGQSSHG